MRIVDANGAHLPALGFGTWTLTGDDAEAMVAAALDAGFRHIDTAQTYANEAEVGRALRASSIARADVFLTTKIWPENFRASRFLDAAARSVERLGTVPDLLLLHWPSKAVPVAETIEVAGRAAQEGLTRHVGLSNFTTPLLADALATGVPLACNQVEYHPFLDQSRVHHATRAAGMALVAYCPLARGRVAQAPEIVDIAARRGASPQQIALAWLLAQDGVAAIPRTANPERLAHNLAAAQIELAADEMAAIDRLRATNYRICDYDFSPVWDAA